VLNYVKYDHFYDPEYLINHRELIEKIEMLSNRLGFNEWHNQIAQEIAGIVSRDYDFISNRVYNLAPSIVYSVVRLSGLPITRKSISKTANVSERGLTKLYQKIMTSLKKHDKRIKEAR
jgi:transcription initiation factor TFIIIB Brf1 subunit/transcription initiation factor TFIIB